MKHTLTLLTAHGPLNDFMYAVDLKPDYKWFVTPTDVEIETTTPIDEPYVMNLIQKSKDVPGVDFWIPAIIYGGQWYIDPSVKVLSDGVKEMFVRREPSNDQQ